MTGLDRLITRLNYPKQKEIVDTIGQLIPGWKKLLCFDGTGYGAHLYAEERLQRD